MIDDEQTSLYCIRIHYTLAHAPHLIHIRRKRIPDRKHVDGLQANFRKSQVVEPASPQVIRPTTNPSTLAIEEYGKN